MEKKNLLWLDDYRDPFDKETDWMVFSPIGRDVNVHWVKDFAEFELWIYDNGLPDAICFDHDLNDEHYCTPEELWDDYKASKEFQEKQVYTEKTGFDCALFVINYCVTYNKPLPVWYSHSANPVGRDKINRVLTNHLHRSVYKITNN